MSTAKRYRQQAARLLACATIAHDEGYAVLAEHPTALAMRYLDRASGLETIESKAPVPDLKPEPRPAQQQQQIQLK